MASRKTGQLIQRGKNKWLIRLSLGTDENGKRVYHSETVEGKRQDAQDVLDAKRKELRTGTFVPRSKASKQPLHAYLKEWVAGKKASPRTLHDYRSIIERYVTDHVIGRVRLDQLAPVGIRAFYKSLQERGLSPRTVQSVHGILHSALEQAVEDGVIPRNPAKLARRALEKVQRSEKQVLSVEQARVFMKQVQGDRFAALWLLLLDTGLRPGEALGLKWSDLDDGNVVRVQRSLNDPRGKGEPWRFGPPKTKAGIRSIPLMPSTVAALREHRKRQIAEQLSVGEKWGVGTEPNMIFTTSVGTYISRSNLHRRHFKPILRAAGLPDMRIYDLRHSAATILLSLGENPKVIQERLGHSDIAITLNVYSHVLEGMQQQATARYAEALGGA